MPPCACKGTRYRPVKASALPWPHVTTHAPEPSTATAAGLDPAQVDGTGDMDVESLRAALHASADLIADYLADVERYAVLPRVAPGELTGRLDGPPPDDPTADGRDPRRHRARRRPERHALAAPGLLRVLRIDRIRPRARRRGDHGRPERERDALADLSGRRPSSRRSPWGGCATGSGCRRASMGSTPTPPRSARSRRSRRPASRPRAMPPSAGSAARRRLAARSGLRVYASQEAHSSIDKAAMTLGIGRDGVRKIAVDDGPRDGPRRARGGDRRGSRRGLVSLRGRVDDRHDVVDGDRPGGRRRRHLRARGHLASRRRGLRRPGRAHPRAPRAVRRLGASRFDRAQPAQVAVHAARLLAAAHPPPRDAARARSASCRSTCARPGGQVGAATTTSPRRSSAGERDRSRCGSCCATSASRACAAGSRPISTSRRWLAQTIDAEPDAERLAPTPFATVCFRWRPARFTGREDDPARRRHAGRAERAPPRAAQRDR